jgi:small subunit ribosomal protein S5
MAIRRFSKRADAAEETKEGPSFDDVVVKVYRCAKVVRGGRRFSFGALVVVGDRNSRVGIGYAKANEVPAAVEKARKRATSSMQPVVLSGPTIPHATTGQFGASRVRLIPANAGTGVIAGLSVRAVLELAGVHDCLTKCYGSTSPKNLVKATMNALLTMRNPETIERLRGVSMAG